MAKTAFDAAVQYADRGCYREALQWYQHCLHQGIQVSEACNNLGSLLQQMGQWEVAEWYYRRGIQQAPHPFLYHGLADCLWVREAYDEALCCVHQGLAEAPDYPPLHNQRGIVLASMKQVEPARLAFAAACQNHHHMVGTPYPEAAFHTAFLDLSVGHWESGFQGYENRIYRKNRINPPVQTPVWQGEAVPRIQVWGEQGIGDVVLFARFLRYLKIPQVDLQVDGRLRALLASVLPASQWVTGPLPDGEAPVPHIQIGSLPHILMRTAGLSMTDPVVHQPYLQAPPDLVAYFREKYTALWGDTFKIGVSWRVRNPREMAKKGWARSFFGQLPARCGPRYTWVVLDGDEATAAHSDPILGFYSDRELDPTQHLDLLCAQMQAMDLVIGIDNSVINMAAAMGRPTWVVLPYACDWRWMETGAGGDPSRTPWYPTARLFRVPEPGSRACVFEQMEKELLTCPIH